MALHSESTRTLPALALLLAASCGGPTSPSPGEPSASSAKTTNSATTTNGDGTLGLAASATPEIFEEFNCRDLEEVHLRFSDPGYVRGSDVGLYASYAGVPAGEKLLRVWWDYANDPTLYHDWRLGEGDVRRDDPSLFDLDFLAEHAYPPVTEPVQRLVRAELILLGKTGNCARNRLVTLNVEPPESTTSEAPAAPGPCEGLRFCRLGDGTVEDVVTGLVWLENADCVGSRPLAVATSRVEALGNGLCGLSDGSAPGDWRFPTLAELQSLLDPRFVDPRLSDAAGASQWSEGDAFSSVANGFYWSSDPLEGCVLGLPGLGAVSLADGDVRCRPIRFGFAHTWPVRAP